MTYSEFEQRLYNCGRISDVVKMCVEHPRLAKKFVALNRLRDAIDSFKELNR